MDDQRQTNDTGERAADSAERRPARRQFANESRRAKKRLARVEKLYPGVGGDSDVSRALDRVLRMIERGELTKADFTPPPGVRLRSPEEREPLYHD